MKLKHNANKQLIAGKRVVLIVIDGLTPSMLEATDAPTLRFLLESGSYRRATSTFPSLTPVCLASIATGGHPDVHGIPHLVWWHRHERRLVDGLLCITAGTGGKGPGNEDFTKQTPEAVFSTMDYGFARVRVTARDTTVQMIDEAGRVRDTVTVPHR